MATADSEAFEGWVILELLGHRVLAGYLSEQELAGKAFLRIDIPEAEEKAPVTQFYSPGAVYAITPTTEEVAKAAARGRRPQPVNRWELEPPRLRPETAEDGDEDWSSYGG